MKTQRYREKINPKKLKHATSTKWIKEKESCAIKKLKWYQRTRKTREIEKQAM